MGIWIGLVTLIYTVIVSVLGGLLVGISLRFITLTEINSWLSMLTGSFYMRTITGMTGLLMILIYISFLQRISGKVKQERSLSFEGPSGQTIIALSAIEDVIKKVISDNPKIKDARPHVVSTKKGMIIKVRIVLFSSVNIAEFSPRIQETIRDRIHELLGEEEPLEIKINIIKVVSPSKKMKVREEKEKDEQEPTIPYRG